MTPEEFNINNFDKHKHNNGINVTFVDNVNSKTANLKRNIKYNKATSL